MNFLEVEGSKIVNIDLLEVVEMDHKKKTATAWNGGVNVVVDSHTLYRYFIRAVLIEMPTEQVPVQVG